MVNQTVRLPDGQVFTVVPVFAGLLFKSQDLSSHHHGPFPVGWTIVLHTEDAANEDAAHEEAVPSSAPPVHSFRTPTLQGDSLFISSISNPSSSEYRPAASPTRHIAFMLYVSLYWYFHQPVPSTVLPATARSSSTPAPGRPRGAWCIRILRDGVLRGRHLIPKLERMGLIASPETSVAVEGGVGGGVGGRDGDGVGDEAGWDNMYVSRSMFWQTPAQLFLFTLQPIVKSGLSSPIGSRPGSPSAGAGTTLVADRSASPNRHTLFPAPVPVASPCPSVPIGPFFSTSHLPTYYPPSSLRYTMTGTVRHPARPKPPRMGEVFYSRFVPSVNQFLSLRVASLAPGPVPYRGPVGPQPPRAEAAALTALSDTALIQQWMALPRVERFWGAYNAGFLGRALASRHSFPAIALWDGVPFGYFELYWVKEDVLGHHLAGAAAAADDFDRGLHVFVGEAWARGRVQQWVTSVAHWCFTTDNRTMGVCIEPRVDNERFIQHLQTAGFHKLREVAFPHKQSWVGRLPRDGWEGPAL